MHIAIKLIQLKIGLSELNVIECIYICETSFIVCGVSLDFIHIIENKVIMKLAYK